MKVYASDNLIRQILTETDLGQQEKSKQELHQRRMTYDAMLQRDRILQSGPIFNEFGTPTEFPTKNPSGWSYGEGKMKPGPKRMLNEKKLKSVKKGPHTAKPSFFKAKKPMKKNPMMSKQDVMAVASIGAVKTIGVETTGIPGDMEGAIGVVASVGAGMGGIVEAVPIKGVPGMVGVLPDPVKGVPGMVGDLPDPVKSVPKMVGTVPGMGELVGTVPGMGELVGAVPGMGELVGAVPGMIGNFLVL